MTFQIPLRNQSAVTKVRTAAITPKTIAAHVITASKASRLNRMR
jgi:hypothetical protein